MPEYKPRKYTIVTVTGTEESTHVVEAQQVWVKDGVLILTETWQPDGRIVGAFPLNGVSSIVADQEPIAAVTDIVT